MRYRQLGVSDLRISVIGLGGNTFGLPRLTISESQRCIERAGELGINFIDTAYAYGGGSSEMHIGRAIAASRNSWIVASKFNLLQREPGESVRSCIARQCEESLRRLGSEYLDLYQIHGKAQGIDDEEILDALSGLVNSGKVRWIGQCNYAAWRHARAIELARQHGWPRMVSCQNHYNLLRRHVEFETLPFCRESDVGFLPYFPLAGGFLTDKYERWQPAPAGTRGAAGSPIVAKSRTVRNEAIQAELKAWAHARGHTLGELAIAWLLSHKEVCSVLTGVSSPEQVVQNVHAAEWSLTDEQRAEVDEIATWDGSAEVAELILG